MHHNLSDIRASFLTYFETHDHAVLPSSSLVPQNDPTLMFANAGMNQFKDIFTGAETPASPRATTSQKCVRAGGKHNDLDNVGYTARHHTFFEMLGNFSFGDYFKEEAITLAWNLLTREWKLPAEKLCVTVYHDDDFAWSTWKKLTGFADHKIIRIPTADNFWAMGDTGPCGPCSEIFYDHGDHIPGGPPGSPDADGDRFIEIWNLVFMQYEQKDATTRIALPKPSIDTGMGLERVAAVLQGVHDNYDIDIFKTLMAAAHHEARHAGACHAEAGTTAYRVIADHLRSSCFLIADGVLPSNEGRGYVLRRIMRRAMRYAHQLGCEDPLMHRLVPTLIAEMGASYPELGRAEASITENLRAEEERFKETLGRGLKLLEESLTAGATIFPGETAFKLYDTYGFPLDLTQDILRQKNIAVDTAGFDACMAHQRDMARAAHKGSGDAATSKIWFALKEKLGATTFLGYTQDEADATVRAIVRDGVDVPNAQTGDEVFVVLDATPFYGESGGQVGDVGMFTTVATITDTQKPLEDILVHTAQLTAPLCVGDRVHAAIDGVRRERTRRHHSATHLLHKALRDLLGGHVTQKGSLVNDEKLRFDFSHGKALSKEEIARIEAEVSGVIARGGAVQCEEMSPDQAIAAGATALFGEKYGATVRVLSMGRSDAQAASAQAYSVELCGGTHVRDVADIGAFKITSEGSVASGIRRIEAVTGEGVRAYMRGEIEALLATLLAARRKAGASDADLPHYDALVTASLQKLPAVFADATAELQAAIHAQEDANKRHAKEDAERRKQAALGDGKAEAMRIGAFTFIGKTFEGLDPKDLREIATTYLKQADVVALFTHVEGKASVLVGVNTPHTNRCSAITLVQQAVGALGGKGGGGKPEIAQGGGPDAARIPDALAAITMLLTASSA